MADSGPPDERRSLLAVSAIPPWPPRNGVSLRASSFLQELAVRWRITVASPLGESASTSAPQGIEWIRIPGVPATDALPWVPERTLFRNHVQSLISDRKFDVGLVWCGAEFVASEIPGFPPTVADRIDCATLQYYRNSRCEEGFRGRLRALRRASEFFFYERGAFRSFPVVVVTGPDDARALRRISGHSRVEAIPNGVHVVTESSNSESETPTVIFSGVLGYPPNVDAVRFFVREVWPLVLAKIPAARFIVAGRLPSPEIYDLGRSPGVELRIDVPDMVEELRAAWVAVAPMRSGSGIKNKVLEAWAAGRPAVLTPLATNGLALDDAARSLVARDAASMAATVVRVLENRELRERLGRSAKVLVDREHGWARLTERLEALLESVLRGRASRGNVL